jgi:hypothetical protein
LEASHFLDISFDDSGAIITILFFFDHKISSIICTVDRYGTMKPGGFSWDIALLGTTTAICGILEIPPAHGLLPQAPLHSESLIHAEKEEFVTTNADGERVVEIKEANRCWNYSCRWVMQALLSDRQYHFYGSVRSVPEAFYAGISTVLSVSPVLCNYRASCI